ncbi:MAG: acyltransferase [Ruminococcus flavefaciens]|nr:acyltransferase [Ruminococcus flavefaciens]
MLEETLGIFKQYDVGKGGNIESNWNKVSKYRKELFGVATILVLLVHSTRYDWLGGQIVFKVFQQGSIGVDVFLFLAGVGLYYSFRKDSNIKNYMHRRIKRVLIPYLIIAIPGYILLDLIVTHTAASTFFLDIFLLRLWVHGSNYTWCISFTIILYLLYPVIYHFLLERRSNFKFSIIFILTLIFNVWMFLAVPEYYSKLELAFARIPVFLLGCWAADWVYSQKPLRAWTPIGFLVIYAVIRGALICSQSMISYEMYVLIVRVSYIFGTFAIVLLVPIVLEKIHLSWLDRILSWVGGLSLEIYLIHNFLRAIYNSTSIGAQNKNVWIYFIFIIPLSLLLTKIYEDVKKRIYRK